MYTEYKSVSLPLLAHNLGFLVGALINVGIILFVLWSARKRITDTAVTFILMAVAVIVFDVSHVLGINAPDASTSRTIFTFNLIDIFIAIFITHWFLCLIGEVKKRWRALLSVYGFGLALFFSYLIYPQTFLIDSIPKLYFPFYYEPGPLYILMVLYFMFVILYFLYVLRQAYRAAPDPIEKNRLKYVLAAISYGYVVGPTAFLLVFDIPFSPVWSMFFNLYTIPLAYAAIRYELFDIRILAKRALIYAIPMIGVGIAVALVNGASDYLAAIEPDFPRWIAWVLTSIVVGGSGVYIWNKTREADILKYEFINIVTHKFRTPLTKIKWATEILERSSSASRSSASGSLDRRTVLATIKGANQQLTELTNALTTLNESEAKMQYNFKPFSFAALAKAALREFKTECKNKKITIATFFDDQTATAYGDEEKISFVLQVLLNNAVTYTPPGGRIRVEVGKRGGNAVELKIVDSGIGIPKGSLNLIRTKFYRANNARKIYTEGSGIGLYIVTEILKRSGGRLDIVSEGEGKGSTFKIILPASANFHLVPQA